MNISKQPVCISSINVNKQKLVSEQFGRIMENRLHTLKPVRSTLAPLCRSTPPTSRADKALKYSDVLPSLSPSSRYGSPVEIPSCVKRPLGRRNLQQELCTRRDRKVNTAHCHIREPLLSQDCWDTWQDRLGSLSVCPTASALLQICHAIRWVEPST